MRKNAMPNIGVNPARAGMIPDSADVGCGGDGKPRASGDDPYGLIPEKVSTE